MDDKTGVSYYTLEETFVSGEIKPLLNLCDFSGISPENEDTGGLLLIRVRTRTKSGYNAASYLLLLDNIKAKPGIIEIGKTGVAGNTNSTNWCNFTFSIENHQLYVTSDNSIGTYSFEITSLGNLGMGDL